MAAKIEAWLEQLWQSNRFLFYTIIPLIGIVYLVIKFRDILINMLVNDSAKDLKDAQAKDAQLANQANQAKQEANQAVEDANNAPSQEKPIDPDWDQK